MVELINIINISFLSLLSLIIGYVGYWHAYHEDTLSKDDKYVRILIFALPPFGLFSFISKFTNIDITYYIIVFSACLIISIIFGNYWRTKGRETYFKNNNINGVSNYKNHLPIINELIKDNRISIIQIFIYLNDGTILKCNNIFNYKDLPVGYLMTDPQKNLAIYVDEIVSSLGEIEYIKEEYNKNNEWENLITYIPYEQIKYIQFRTI
ncbi:MAG: hypothetical protein FWE18_03540 [Alphaproteobacteria bacterium]|nr:hypothetical protein [Alphaproteobacteria bacterium]